MGNFGWFCNKGWVESCDLVKALKSVKFLLKRVKVLLSVLKSVKFSLKRVKVLLKRVKKCKVFTKTR